MSKVLASDLDVHVPGGSSGSDSGHSPLHVKLPCTLEWALYPNNLKVVVLPVACAPFFFYHIHVLLVTFL